MRKGSNRTTALAPEQFKRIVQEFIHRPDHRMAFVCILLGKCVRVGDVLTTITVDDIYTEQGDPRPRVRFVEQKTRKHRTVRLAGPVSYFVAREYYREVAQLDRGSTLFFNKQGTRLRDKGVKKLLSHFVGQGSILQCSPHSFRKYGAKLMFNNGVDIEIISQILNHSSVTETRTYLDIKPKEVEQAMKILDY